MVRQGFIEETGAAQHLRDARIGPIYEGTNGIQAADFVSRKLPLESGQVLASLMNEIYDGSQDEAPELAGLALDCREIGEWMLEAASIDDRLASSVPYLTMSAVAVAGWQLLRQARATAVNGSPSSKHVVCRYFL